METLYRIGKCCCEPMSMMHVSRQVEKIGSSVEGVRGLLGSVAKASEKQRQPAIF
jgi:hypothetical protein